MTVAEALELYIPLPLVVPPDAGLDEVATVYVITLKLATNIRFAVAVKVKLGLVETATPLSVQLTNWYPEAGVAVIVTDVPELYVRLLLWSHLLLGLKM